MFENIKPKFAMGKILKIGMLDSLNNFPRDFIDINYKEYSDGIINGCHINISENFLSINKGIVRYNGKMYFLRKNHNVEYECNNKYMIIKIRFLETENKEDFEINLAEIILEDNLIISSNEIEICRFKLREGARLRSNYTDFKDFSTEFDTVNIINSPYASISGQTISPEITYQFGKELNGLELENAYDIAFSFMLLQNRGLIENKVITSYIKRRISIQKESLTNQEIYEYLLQILNLIKNNGNGTNTNNGRRRKILLD